MHVFISRRCLPDPFWRRAWLTPHKTNLTHPTSTRPRTSYTSLEAVPISVWGCAKFHYLTPNTQTALLPRIRHYGCTIRLALTPTRILMLLLLRDWRASGLHGLKIGKTPNLQIAARFARSVFRQKRGSLKAISSLVRRSRGEMSHSSGTHDRASLPLRWSLLRYARTSDYPIRKFSLRLLNSIRDNHMVHESQR